MHWTRTGDGELATAERRGGWLAAAGRAAALLFLLYATAVALFHPVYLHWGTTPAERMMTLPGDEVVPDARYRVDHGITIRAPADSGWPFG